VSLEPSIAGMITPAPGALVDWTVYGRCRICRAETGQPCTSVYGRIVAGRPEGGARPLPVAHGHRKRRHGR
jgi:hypothetical protein